MQRYLCMGIVCVAIWHSVVFLASPHGGGKRGMGGLDRDMDLAYEDEYFVSKKVRTNVGLP